MLRHASRSFSALKTRCRDCIDLWYENLLSLTLSRRSTGPLEIHISTPSNMIVLSTLNFNVCITDPWCSLPCSSILMGAGIFLSFSGCSFSKLSEKVSKLISLFVCNLKMIDTMNFRIHPFTFLVLKNLNVLHLKNTAIFTGCGFPLLHMVTCSY